MISQLDIFRKCIKTWGERGIKLKTYLKGKQRGKSKISGE